LRLCKAREGPEPSDPASDPEKRSPCCTEEVVGYFFRGTFAPFLRASESPIAIACFLLLTLVVPFFPDVNVPLLRLCIARLTLFCAAFPYFRGMVDLREIACKVTAKKLR